MTHYARKMIALSTALSMLALLALPSYAICGCEEPGGMPCCDPASAPEAPVVVKLEAETASCCSAEPEPAPVAESCSMETSTADLAYAATGCEQDVISASLPTASLPTQSASQETDGSTVVSAIAAVPATVAATHATFARDHRAPPPRPVAAFILNAALLI